MSCSLALVNPSERVGGRGNREEIKWETIKNLFPKEQALLLRHHHQCEDSRHFTDDNLTPAGSPLPQ